MSDSGTGPRSSMHHRRLSRDFRLGILVGMALIVPVLAVLEDTVIRRMLVHKVLACVRRHGDEGIERILVLCADPQEVFGVPHGR